MHLYIQMSSLPSRYSKIISKFFCPQPFFQFRTQVNIELVACILHNYILDVDTNDKIFQLSPWETEDVLTIS